MNFLGRLFRRKGQESTAESAHAKEKVPAPVLDDAIVRTMTSIYGDRLMATANPRKFLKEYERLALDFKMEPFASLANDAVALQLFVSHEDCWKDQREERERFEIAKAFATLLTTRNNGKTIAKYFAQFVKSGFSVNNMQAITPVLETLSSDHERQLLFEVRTGFRSWSYGPYSSNNPNPEALQHFTQLIKEGSDGQTIAHYLAQCDTYYLWRKEKRDDVELTLRHMSHNAARELLVKHISYVRYGSISSENDFVKDCISTFSLNARETQFLEGISSHLSARGDRRLHILYLFGDRSTRTSFSKLLDSLSLSDISALASQTYLPTETNSSISVDGFLEFLESTVAQLSQTPLDQKFQMVWKSAYDPDGAYAAQVQGVSTSLSPEQKERLWQLTQGKNHSLMLRVLSNLVLRDTPDLQFTSHYFDHIADHVRAQDLEHLLRLEDLSSDQMRFISIVRPGPEELTRQPNRIPKDSMFADIVSAFPDFFVGKSFDEVLTYIDKIPLQHSSPHEHLPYFLGLIQRHNDWFNGDFQEFCTLLKLYEKIWWGTQMDYFKRFLEDPECDIKTLEIFANASGPLVNLLNSYPRIDTFLRKCDLKSICLILEYVPNYYYSSPNNNIWIELLLSSKSIGLDEGDSETIKKLMSIKYDNKDIDILKEACKENSYTLDQILLLVESEQPKLLRQYRKSYGENINTMREFSDYFSSLQHQTYALEAICIPDRTYTIQQLDLYYSLLEQEGYGYLTKIASTFHHSAEESLEDIRAVHREVVELLGAYAKTHIPEKVYTHRGAYAGNIENLRYLCREVTPNADYELPILAQFEDAIRENPDMLRKVYDVLKCDNYTDLEIVNLEIGQARVITGNPDVMELIKNNLDMLIYLRELNLQLGLNVMNSPTAASRLKLLIPFIREGKDAIPALKVHISPFISHVSELNTEQVDLLIKYQDAFTTNISQCIFAIELVKIDKEDLLQALSQHHDLYGENVETMKVCAEYFTTSKFFNHEAWVRFQTIYQEESPEAARTYIKQLIQEAKGLIGADPPLELRNRPDYTYLVGYVFPKGNYSSHENNLSNCNDQLDHVAGYAFDAQGYPTTMTGLLGYRLLDGKTEDTTLLEEYQRRLGQIRNFVSSRGPDNEALQKAFEEKIQVKIQALPARWDAIKNRKDLKANEKLLVLFLEEAVKRHLQKNSKPDPEVLDLLIEYKYAYKEELEGYIQRTADETSKFKDPISQRFNLWRELSTIYGENMKHVLRHDIFESLAEDDTYRREIEVIFSNALSDAKTDFSLSNKQRERISSTFTNPHISDDNKLDILTKQIIVIYGANLKYSSESARIQFNDDMRNALAVCEEAGHFSPEYFFEHVAPRLESIRLQYALNISGVLEDIFTMDINLINQEVAKYEEVIETEMKQTAMGGERHKAVEKRAKKRNIRGYITKTKETSNARMGAYLCIAGDSNMWKNPNYFELVLKDEDSGKCVGVVMLLKIEAKDGKKYLWFGPNPFESFLGQVSSEQCYDYMYQTVTHFAEENGFDGVVIPSQESQILGACTNRGGDFPDLIKRSRLCDSKGDIKTVQYGQSHTLGSSYSYSDGALIWERK